MKSLLVIHEKDLEDNENIEQPQNPQLNIGAVISRFSSTVEKQQSFYNELKALLVKYDAELTIEDFGRNWQSDEKIVVDFKYDESFFEKENTGIVPQLVLGRWENGL